MDQAIELDFVSPIAFAKPAYDPNNLHPLDAEDRLHDDNSSGIDWVDIIATTEDDWRAGRFAYDSSIYATEAEADTAFTKFFDDILAEVAERKLNEPPSRTDSPATCP